MNIVPRIVASVCFTFVYSILIAIYSPPATLISGQVAGKQFDNSDASYLTATYTMNFLASINGLLTLFLFVILVAIWLRPVRELIKKATAAVAVLLLIGIGDGHAFFEKTDRTEVYLILPNESAFWIPDVGANKETQTAMDSEAYLEANKLAAKRFAIPHQKLTGSAGTSWTSGWDYFVPSGRLIIVDRTPFSREWVDADDRGTSKSKEGFPCQSKEGLNVTTGVSIGTSVLPASASKFLYRFGVKSPVGQIKGDASNIEADGKIIFTSVYFGRSLKEVMDDVGRKKVQTLVCEEISSRTFDKVNEEANKIMETVTTKTKDYFASVGITLDFIGWADTFEFDKDVQKAVNDKYAADKLASVLPVLQALAQLKVQEGLGKGLETKGPPIVVTPDMINALIGMVKSPPTQ